MTELTTRFTAALVAVLIATTSMAAIVTVPPVDSMPAVASIGSNDLA